MVIQNLLEEIYQYFDNLKLEEMHTDALGWCWLLIAPEQETERLKARVNSVLEQINAKS